MPVTHRRLGGRFEPYWSQGKNLSLVGQGTGDAGHEGSRRARQGQDALKTVVIPQFSLRIV